MKSAKFIVPLHKTPTHKRIPLILWSTGENHLEQILSVLWYFKHNESHMHH